MSNDALNPPKLFKHFLVMRPTLFVSPSTIDEFSHFEKEFGRSPLFLLRKLVQILFKKIGIEKILSLVPFCYFIPSSMMILAKKEIRVLYFLESYRFAFVNFIHLFLLYAKNKFPIKIRKKNNIFFIL